MTDIAPVETVDDAAEDVPTPVTPEPPHVEPETHSEPDNENEVVAAIERMGATLIEAINTLKESSPVTPAEEMIIDETPIKKPWTHRGFGH